MVLRSLGEERSKHRICWLNGELIAKSFGFHVKRVGLSPESPGKPLKALEVTSVFVTSVSRNGEKGTESGGGEQKKFKGFG